MMLDKVNGLRFNSICLVEMIIIVVVIHINLADILRVTDTRIYY